MLPSGRPYPGMCGRLGLGLRFGFDFFFALVNLGFHHPKFEVEAATKTPSKQSLDGARGSVRRRQTEPALLPHLDFQNTLKLVPSVVRAVGSASVLPPLLTIVIFSTFFPKSLMGPVTAASVA